MAQTSLNATSYQPTGGKCEVSFLFFSSSKCLLKNFIDFNWRIITLLYCHGFCRISVWISRRYTCVPSILNPPPTSLPTLFLQVVRALALGAKSYIKFALVFYFTYGNVYVSMLFSQFSPSPTESKSLFFTSVSPLLPYT